MARNRATCLVCLRLGLAVASWGVALVLAQAVLGGADITGPARELEHRIELRLRGPAAAPPGTSAPARSHEDESLEPWELVSV